jgi:signal peptidase I
VTAAATGRADRAARAGRAGREAVRFARDARRLARRHAKALGKVVGEVETAADEVETAVKGGKPDTLAEALQELSTLWDTHLASRQRPLWLESLQLVAVAVLLALVTRAFVADTSRVTSVSMEPTILPGDVLLVRKAAYAIRIPFTHLRLLDTSAPRRGDVIVFDDPRDPQGSYVKRVVGVPGDVIELREQVLNVNGVPQPRTLVGEYAVAEEGGAGTKGASICRRYHETLAQGELSAPSDGGGDGLARWDAAAKAGLAVYDILQCRRPRPDSREGPFEVVRPGHVFVLGDNRDHSADSRGLGGWQVPYGNIRGRASAVLLSWGEGGWWLRGSAGLRFDRLFKAVGTR